MTTSNDELITMVNDLKVQSMMFDMDIDYETLDLIPKTTYKEDSWITKWKEKRDASDNLPESPEQAGWE